MKRRKYKTNVYATFRCGGRTERRSEGGEQNRWAQNVPGEEWPKQGLLAASALTTKTKSREINWYSTKHGEEGETLCNKCKNKERKTQISRNAQQCRITIIGAIRDNRLGKYAT